MTVRTIITIVAILVAVLTVYSISENNLLSSSAVKPELENNSVNSAEPALVPQIGWPGTCEAQGWSADDRTAMGFFSSPVPALVKWSAKSWEVISYRPLADVADPTLVNYGSLSPDSRYLLPG